MIVAMRYPVSFHRISECKAKLRTVVGLHGTHGKFLVYLLEEPNALSTVGFGAYHRKSIPSVDVERSVDIPP